eukprot:scpid21483/ scgid3336/ 
MASQESQKELDLLRRLDAVRRRKAEIDQALARKKPGAARQGVAQLQSSSRAGTIPHYHLRYEEWKQEKQRRLAELKQEREELLAKMSVFYSGTGVQREQQPTVDRVLTEEEIESAVERAEAKIPLWKERVQHMKISEKAYRRWVRMNYSRHSCDGWQLQDYDMMRGLVVDVLLPRVLERCFDERDHLEVRRRQHERDLKALQRQEEEARFLKGMTSELDIIIHSVVKLKVREVAGEVLSLGGWTGEASRAICAVAAYQQSMPQEVVQESWRRIVRQRAAEEEDHISVHTQKLSLLGEDGSVTVGDEPTLITWNDVKVLQNTASNQQTGGLCEEDEDFEQTELQYWKGFMAKPLVQLQNPFASKWEVTAACLDDGHDQLALAYKDGTIVIWYTDTRQPFACVNPSASQPSVNQSSPVLHLAWSCDSKRLAGVHGNGSLSVWSRQARPARQSVVSTQATVAAPARLRKLLSRGSILSLPVQAQAILSELSLFITEPAASITGDLNGDNKVSHLIWPSRTAMGSTQDRLVFGLTCGTIVQLVLDPSTGVVRMRSTFQGHCARLVALELIKNQAVMMSMDEDGVLCKWSQSSSCQNVRGWYSPIAKFRLNLLETRLVHLQQYDKLTFTDKKTIKRSSKQVSKERWESEQTISNLKLPQQAWHYSTTNITATSVMAPQHTIPDSRTTFYSITRMKKDNRLVQLEEHLYEPQPGDRMPLLATVIDPSRHVLLVALLSQGSPPRDPYITLLQICLSSFEVVTPRVDVLLSAGQVECVRAERRIAMAISDELLHPGCRYALLVAGNILQVVSLATGQTVMCASDVAANSGLDRSGCQLRSNQARIPAPTSKLHALHSGTSFSILVTEKSMVSVLELHRGDNGGDDNGQSEAMVVNNKNYRAAFAKHSYYTDESLVQRQHPPPHCLLSTAGDEPYNPTAVAEYIKDLLAELAENAVDNVNSRQSQPTAASSVLPSDNPTPLRETRRSIANSSRHTSRV